MIKNVIRSDEENIIAENYEANSEAARTVLEDTSKVGPSLSPLFKQKFYSVERSVAISKTYWTLDCVVKLI